MPVPGPILADLIVVQPDLAFGLFKASSTRHRQPATWTRVAREVSAGAKQTEKARSVGSLRERRASNQKPTLAGQPQRHSGTRVQS